MPILIATVYVSFVSMYGVGFVNECGLNLKCLLRGLFRGSDLNIFNMIFAHQNNMPQGYRNFVSDEGGMRVLHMC